MSDFVFGIGCEVCAWESDVCDLAVKCVVVTDGEIEGKCLPSRWRTAWIDDVRRRTVGGLPAARQILLDRL